MLSKKIKVLHIHTDHKFVDGSFLFIDHCFDNTIVIITDQMTPKKTNDINFQYLQNNNKGLLKIINLCNQCDIVVAYGLSFINQYIITKLRQNVKVIWRLFGYELYSKIPEHLFSNRTLVYHREKSVLRKANKIVKMLFEIHLLHFRLNKLLFDLKYSFEDIVNRIDGFLCLSSEEYDFLKKHFPFLPTKLLTPFENNVINCDLDNKSPLIIIGVNRYPENNHIDVIDILKTSNESKKYSINFFFSYGNINQYTKSVKKLSQGLPNCNFIEDFLPTNRFQEKYKTASAFVLNSYREMGVGNVFTAIRSSVKIYLNPKNIVYHWLINNEFLIFTIEDFSNDLDRNNIKLTLSEAQHNIQAYRKFVNKYSVQKFQQEILDFYKKEITEL